MLSSHCETLSRLKTCAEHTLAPLVLLAMRLVVGKVFITSGWFKLGYVIHGQLDSLYSIFEDYKVPLLPTHLAAWLGMSGELGFGIMLALGLFGRLGALGLIFLSGVIYHTDGNPLALYWVLICAMIAAVGPGKWSADAFLHKKCHTRDAAV